MTSAWRIGYFQAMIASVSINGRSTSVEETNVLTSGTNSSLTVNFQPFSFLMRCNEWSRWAYSCCRLVRVSSTCDDSREQRLAIRSTVISLPTANKMASIRFSLSFMVFSVGVILLIFFVGVMFFFFEIILAVFVVDDVFVD